MNGTPQLTNDPFQFHEASERDLTIILDFTIKLHQHEDDGKIKSHKNFKKHLEDWLRNEISNPRSLFIVVENFSTPIGFIGATSIINDNGFLENPIKGLIQLLWLDPEFRGEGIAKNLIDEIEHCFKTIGIQYIECSYTANNMIAEKFWSKSGYKIDSITARKILN